MHVPKIKFILLSPSKRILEFVFIELQSLWSYLAWILCCKMFFPLCSWSSTCEFIASGTEEGNRVDKKTRKKPALYTH